MAEWKLAERKVELRRIVVATWGQPAQVENDMRLVQDDGYETATVQPVPSEASNPDQQRQHEGSGMMPMMHGSGGWHWAGMGVMMAMMVLVVL